MSPSAFDLTDAAANSGNHPMDDTIIVDSQMEVAEGEAEVAAAQASNPQTSTDMVDKVCIVGSGNWGSAIATIIGRNTRKLPHLFESQVNMWVYEEMVDVEVDGHTGKKKLTEVRVFVCVCVCVFLVENGQILLVPLGVFGP